MLNTLNPKKPRIRLWTCQVKVPAQILVFYKYISIIITIKKNLSYLNPSKRGEGFLAWPQSNNITFYQQAYWEVDKVTIPIDPVE